MRTIEKFFSKVKTKSGIVTAKRREIQGELLHGGRSLRIFYLNVFYLF